MGRFLGFLIIVGGLVGLYFVYQDYAVKTKAKRNSSADEIAHLIDIQRRADLSKDVEGVLLSSEGNLYRIMAHLRQAEQSGYNVSSTLTTAASNSSARPGEARLITELLNENYRTLKQLQVFNELGNLLKMEGGNAPTAKAPEWEGEKVTVGFVLSPVYAPEAVCSLANLMLMPESARNTQTESLASFSTEQSKKWLVERIITPESHQLILDTLQKDKGKSAAY